MPARALASRKPQNRKPTLSPTRINTYLDCAVKYKYVYQDKIGRFYMRARAGYSFGSTLHHVLQKFHEEGGTKSADEMKVELQTNWIAAGYETPKQEQEHREIGEQIVAAYHTAHQERAVPETETFASEKTITCDLGRFKLSGRVDRIDRHADGRLEIVDYKSGRNEVTEEDVANSLAMSCYQLILNKLYPGAGIFATIYNLRSGTAASSELKDADRLKFEQDIIELGAEILDREYDSLIPIPLEICPYCDFLPRCSRFWKSEERTGMAELPSDEYSTMIDSPHSDFGL